MNSPKTSTFLLGKKLKVARLGYGAMQLTGPGSLWRRSRPQKRDSTFTDRR